MQQKPIWKQGQQVELALWWGGYAAATGLGQQGQFELAMYWGGTAAATVLRSKRCSWYHDEVAV
jgi:hypothetical protein